MREKAEEERRRREAEEAAIEVSFSLYVLCVCVCVCVCVGVCGCVLHTQGGRRCYISLFLAPSPSRLPPLSFIPPFPLPLSLTRSLAHSCTFALVAYLCFPRARGASSVFPYARAAGAYGGTIHTHAGGEISGEICMLAYVVHSVCICDSAFY